jgi:hypothetical protein
MVTRAPPPPDYPDQVQTTPSQTTTFTSIFHLYRGLPCVYLLLRYEFHLRHACCTSVTYLGPLIWLPYTVKCVIRSYVISPSSCLPLANYIFPPFDYLGVGTHCQCCVCVLRNELNPFHPPHCRSLFKVFSSYALVIFISLSFYRSRREKELL